MIIQPDPDTMDSLSAQLSTIFSEVITYCSINEAIKHMHGQLRPGLVVVDIHPDSSSIWHLFEHMRSESMSRKTMTTPILTTSNILSEDEYRNCFPSFPSSAYLSLPCETDSMTTTIESILRSDHPIPKQRVLSIDDDRRITSYLQRILSARGYEVREALNVNSAMQILHIHEIDTIILDHNINHDTGFDMVRNLAKKNLSILTIVATSEICASLAHEYATLGVDWFINKPFAVDYLIDTITHAHHERSLKATEQTLLKKLT
jgi:DNA-binding NtrC family response regulator